jgi:hypothetical protein
MEMTTLIWMILMLGAILGPFIYFAMLAGSKEKTKTEE